MIFTMLANNEPSISIEGLYIPEFKEIWKRDKSKDKTLAKAELAYIYHMVHPKSPYALMTDSDKDMSLKKDYLINFKDWKADDKVRAAMNKLESLIETPSYRLFKAAKNTVDKLAVYFNDIEMSNKSDDEVGKIISNMNNMEKAIKTLKTIELAVKQESDLSNEQVRGGATFSILEDVEFD